VIAPAFAASIERRGTADFGASDGAAPQAPATVRQANKTDRG
jgi:hypothetical protein